MESMTTPGFATVGGKKIRAFLDYHGNVIEVYDEKTKSYVNYGKYMDIIKKGDTAEVDMDIIKKDDTAKVGRPLKLGKENKEKRVVAGKARSVKLVEDKVTEVYDEVSGQYLPIKEFSKLYDEKGERIGVDDIKVTKDKKGEVKIPRAEIAEIAETGDVPKDVSIISVKIDSDNKKEEEKEYDNIVDEYIDLLFNE